MKKLLKHVCMQYEISKEIDAYHPHEARTTKVVFLLYQSKFSQIEWINIKFYMHLHSISSTLCDVFYKDINTIISKGTS